MKWEFLVVWTRTLQPLPDLRKGCVTRKFVQVEFYLSWNFPKFSSIQLFLPVCAEKITETCLEICNKKDKDKCQYEKGYYIVLFILYYIIIFTGRQKFT